MKRGGRADYPKRAGPVPHMQVPAAGTTQPATAAPEARAAQLIGSLARKCRLLRGAIRGLMRRKVIPVNSTIRLQEPLVNGQR